MYEAYFTKRLLDALSMADDADDPRERQIHLRTSRYYRDLLEHTEMRQSTRHSVRIEAVIRYASPDPQRVIVSDLSTRGFRMEFDEPVTPGMFVILEMQGLAPLEARIVWHADHDVGCEFLRELHPALLDAALAVSPRPE